MEWIRVQEKLPEEGSIVLAWMSKRKEPVCVRFERDQHGPVWRELVQVDILDDREDLISHWIPIPHMGGSISAPDIEEKT